MKAWQAVLVGVLVLTLGLLATALAMPKGFVVERSVTIQAPLPLVLGIVEDLQRFPTWSPWSAADPTTTHTLGSVVSGEGASVAWVGAQGASGALEVQSVESPRRITTALVLDGQSTWRSTYTFSPTDGGVRVTWGLTGSGEGPFGGVFAMFMDGTVGPLFEQGLSGLKALAESDAQTLAAGLVAAEALREGSEPMGMLPPIP